MKVGDIVRVKRDSPYINTMWDHNMVVTEISNHPDMCDTICQLLEGTDVGLTGGFQFDDLELVDVNKSMTDQELADAYRKARQDCQSLYAELTRRSMSVSSSTPLKIWRIKTIEETF